MLTMLLLGILVGFGLASIWDSYILVHHDDEK